MTYFRRNGLAGKTLPRRDEHGIINWFTCKHCDLSFRIKRKCDVARGEKLRCSDCGMPYKCGARYDGKAIAERVTVTLETVQKIESVSTDCAELMAKLRRNC